MGTYTQTTTFSNGATADGGEVNAEIVALGSSVNNIVNAQVASGAAIAQTKLSFTDPAAWTPGYTGFSVNPTLTYAYSVKIGKLVTVWYRQNVSGTSNATGFTITGLPYALAAACTDLSFPVRAINAGAYLTTGPIGVITASGTTLTLYSTAAGGAWTASGSKGAESFSITYPTD